MRTTSAHISLLVDHARRLAAMIVLIAILFALFADGASSHTLQKPPSAAHQAKRVLVISLDGLDTRYLSGFTTSYTKKAHDIVDFLIGQRVHDIIDSFAQSPINRAFHNRSARPLIGSYEREKFG